MKVKRGEKISFSGQKRVKYSIFSKFRKTNTWTKGRESEQFQIHLTKKSKQIKGFYILQIQKTSEGTSVEGKKSE